MKSQIEIEMGDIVESKALADFGLRYLSFLPKRSAFSSLSFCFSIFLASLFCL
jgi:hypothetical protein